MNSPNTPAARARDSAAPRTATLTLSLTEADSRYLVARALRHDLPALLTFVDLALVFSGRDGEPLSPDALRKKLKRLRVPVAHVGADGGPIVERDDLLAAIRRAVRR